MGYLSDELINKPFWGLIPKDYIAPVILQFKKTLFSEVVEIGFKIINKNMEIRHVHMTCMPITKDNNVVGVYAIIKDVTEKRG